ncbi:beta-1,3-glucan-binding protein-like [Ruditapes philippinarum]|uniref:beta-1,3-glucan-binding protein-like n=1 Tax=Ruditapes philippinarum TaxID=129788 RepID=UPI00295AEE2E|nr:beta-1,3-glucan-binding protein-like [Ruditapes philippinarum]
MIYDRSILSTHLESRKTKYEGTNMNTDGRWYHRINAAAYNGKDKIKYTIVGEIDGETVVTKGKLHPQERSVVLAPPRVLRACRTVFRDDFNGAFDASHWNYEVSMYGGYNWEIQAYVPEARNIFTRNGHLFIKPSMYGYCTNSDRWGCYRAGKDGLLPPVMSGKLKIKKHYQIWRGYCLCQSTKGENWIWPAIWMLPRDSHYGQWPRSGEIDIMESRGNSQATDGSGHNHGVNEVGATMHWGPDAGQNRFTLTHGDIQGDWSHAIHCYHLSWTVDHIRVTVDNREIMNIPIHQSFWQKGGFSGSNIWGSGTKAAPFDQPFYLILNVAVGGTSGFFPDGWTYNSPKPWRNDSPHENADFWNARNNWLGSWHGDDVAMEIDYVEMKQC